MLDKNIFIEHLLREYQKMDSSEKVEITTQEIISIRNEYHQLLTLKKNCLQIITEFRQIHLPTLSGICAKYETIEKPQLQHIAPQMVMCDLYHNFSSQTQKGINSHKRKCQKSIHNMDCVTPQSILSVRHGICDKSACIETKTPLSIIVLTMISMS